MRTKIFLAKITLRDNFMSSKITIFIFAFPTFQDVELFPPAPSDYTIFGVFFRDSPLGMQDDPIHKR